MHLDTSFLIDLQRERQKGGRGVCHQFLEHHANLPMRVSAVAAMEYLEGFSDIDLALNQAFLAAFDLVAVDLRVALRASRIRRNLRFAGNLLPDADLLIAACAIEQDEPLATENANHFGRIEGLRMINYK